MKSYLIILLSVIIILNACASEVSDNLNANQNANAENANAVENAEEPVMEGDLLYLDETGETAAYECKKREVEIDGTANNYNFTGECKKLTVKGVSNKVKVEKVGEIIVEGNSNKITYGEGLDGKEPKITKDGITPTVEKIKDAEEASEK